MSQHRRIEGSPQRRETSPQCYEVKLLTLQDRIAAVVGSRAAVVIRRCACVWCPAKPGMSKQCLIAPALPVRAPMSVPVARPWCPLFLGLPVSYLVYSWCPCACPCADVPVCYPSNPVSVLPVLCLLSSTPRPCLLEPMLIHARSWPPACGGPAMFRV